MTQRECANCGTSATSTWRTLDGKIVCNACKCFYRKHGYPRPLTMRKDTIASRKRMKTEVGEVAQMFCFLLERASEIK